MALKIVVIAREQGTGNREQGTGNREQKRGFRQFYFSLLMSVFFRSPNSEGTGNREQGTEKRFQTTLLFVT
ncbi:MAG: hypothetical protein ACK5S7_10020 [Dolichospermum sp.]